MATNLMTPGARPANPDTTTTRRTVLAAALALPVAAATTLPALASTANVTTTEWDRALAAYRIADAASNEAYERWGNAHDAYCDEANALAKPQLMQGFAGVDNGHSLEDIEKKQRDWSWGAGTHASKDDRIAHEIGELRAYRENVAAIRARLQCDRYSAEMDATRPIIRDARARLMAVPAPSIQALAAKLEAADDSDESHDICIADAFRLAAREA